LRAEVRNQIDAWWIREPVVRRYLNFPPAQAILAPMSTSEPTEALTGYLHPRYARSYHEFGTPRRLPRCGGWVLERLIPGFGENDAMGCYPLFSCPHWSALHADLDELEGELVSLTLVTDPFGEYEEPYLRRCFPDLVVPFKQHSVIDLDKPHDQVISRRHRKEARRALRQLSVHRHPNPPEFLDVWMSLHEQLVARHNVKGIAAFSRSAFAEQLATPGMVVFWASHEGVPVAATLYLCHKGVAYGHVLGCTDLGYQHGALYALIWTAIETFTGSMRWINLMGVPGGEDAGSEGIRQFKRGWTQETRTAWLCGRVLNRPRFDAIVAATGTAKTQYFPAYRDGEMARLSPR
jgi:hypothetical protein